ncbi:MAG: hypothetical protein CW716_08885 [Candidatus Bathyarchaeum sp.]|nr:MAG: hypothetical protein CW716_08885 [Candidatus Bathyarchaeum sp.]
MSGPRLAEPLLPPSVARLVKESVSVLKKFELYISILTVKNIDEKGEIMVNLAGYDGTNYVVKPLKTLNPDESHGLTENQMKIVEDFKPDAGIQAILRTNSARVFFEVKNLRSISLNYRRIQGEDFPWWGKSPIYYDISTIASNAKKKDYIREGEQVILWYGNEIVIDV